MRSYGPLTALLYDVFSGERPLYRPGRLAAIEALRLRPGDHVLVLGCGTGLDLPPIARAIGPSGVVVAVDRSPAMLRATARRTRTALGAPRDGWPPVRLVRADLTRSSVLLPPGQRPVDAVLAVNTLSLITGWRTAWRHGVAAARPGARAAIADIGRPDPRRPALVAWSRWISFVGGGDLDAAPWNALDEGAGDPVRRTLLAGHVRLRAGTLDGSATPR